MSERPGTVRAALVGCALALGAGAPAAQVVRPDSLPPLPDRIALYGDTLSVRFDPPDLAPPAGSVRLSLAEAVRAALSENPAFAIVELEARRAENDATRGNAGMLPTLDASASVAGDWAASILGGDSAGASTSGATRLGAGVALGYTLFDGGRRGATLRRLREEARRAGLTVEAEADAVAFAVISAYLEVIRQEALVGALVEAAAVSEDRLRIENAEVSIGTAADIDAALALSDLNADRAAIVRQGVALTQARTVLGELLDLPRPEAVEATDSLAVPPAPDLAALEARAAEGNSRLRALEVGESVAREAMAEVRAEYSPRVALSAGAGVSAFDRGFLPAGDPEFGPDVSYGVTASIPIFDGGDRRRRTENARIRLEQAQMATADGRSAVRARAARLVAAARGFRQLAELEVQNRAVARQNVRVALAQFQLGFITPIDLRQVQLALLDVETRLVNAIAAAVVAEAELRLLGGQQ